MHTLDLEKIDSIYFVGIGGIAMSATAGIAGEAGYRVFGSDAKEAYSPAKDVLDSHDIEYNLGYNSAHIVENPADVYILSAGEGLQNPEVKYIIDNDLPYFSFSELLYELYKDKLRIVVSGTHGKSTTSGLLGILLEDLDNSSFMVGAVIQGQNYNFHNGSGHYAVFEGDEYKATFDDVTPKFHYYRPDILVLTNLEFDHPDIFANLEEIMDEFTLLINAMPADGLIIYNADDVNVAKLIFQSNVANLGYSVHGPSDYQAVDIQYQNESTTFTVIDSKQPEAQREPEGYKIALPGQINIYNVMAAIATLRSLGFKAQQFQEKLLDFYGVKRRFEIISKTKDIVIIDDYAHHPTAVRETLEAARTRYPNNRIWAIFEPHTFSRTKATLNELVDSFKVADKVLLAEIYPARENIKNATITSAEVIAELSKHHSDTKLVKNKQEALDLLKKEIKPGDVVIVMAVGSFNKLAYELRDSIS